MQRTYELMFVVRPDMPEELGRNVLDLRTGCPKATPSRWPAAAPPPHPCTSIRRRGSSGPQRRVTVAVGDRRSAGAL